MYSRKFVHSPHANKVCRQRHKDALCHNLVFQNLQEDYNKEHKITPKTIYKEQRQLIKLTKIAEDVNMAEFINNKPNDYETEC